MVGDQLIQTAVASPSDIKRIVEECSPRQQQRDIAVELRDP